MFEEIINSTPILIVGADHVGMTTGLFLSSYHIPFVIIDKKQYRTSKMSAIAINQVGLDVFRELGIYEEVDRKSLKIQEVNVFYRNQLLAKLNFKNLSNRYSNFFYLEQNELENIMRTELQKQGVIIFCGCELIKIEKNTSSIIATIVENGIVKKINTTFLLGCDGAESTTRKLADIGIDSTLYEGYCIIADVSLNNSYFEKKQVNCFLTKAGYAVIVSLPNNRHRIIVSLKSKYDSNKIQITQQYIIKLMRERTNLNLEISNIHWSMHSVYSHCIAKQSVQDNIILAGDSLHQFSPIGGTNINIGIQDAAILGKLLPQLLNTSDSKKYLKAYEEEYLQYSKAHLDFTSYLTRMMTRNNGMKKYKRPWKAITLEQFFNEDLTLFLMGFYK